MTFRTIGIAAIAIAAVTASAMVAVGEEAAAPAGPYVGAEKCKMCHMPQYNTWKNTTMATAWERVKEAEDVAKCLPCHTTGFGQPGGFTSIEATPHLVGVQCEACHGPGQAHLATPMSDKEARRASMSRNAADGAPDCRGCHSPHVPDKAAAVRAG